MTILVGRLGVPIGLVFVAIGPRDRRAAGRGIADRLWKNHAGCQPGRGARASCRNVTVSITLPVTARPDDGLAAMDELTTKLTDLYQEHYRQLLRIAALLVDDRSSAEDIVQDAFLRVFDARARLRDPEKALAFLRQAVLNRARSTLRRRMVARKYQPRLATRDEHPDDTGRGVDRAVLADALARLPRRQREAVVLRYYADFSEARTAELMRVSQGAVKSYCSRGVARLSDLLRERV